MKVGLFIPCYIDAFFPEVGIATLELLERLGCSVEYPLQQTCCGQPMANSGCQEDAAATEAHFVHCFEEFDTVIGPSGSCVHHIRCHLDAIEQTTAVKKVRAGTRELVEFLHDHLKVVPRYTPAAAELGVRQLVARPSCHRASRGSREETQPPRAQSQIRFGARFHFSPAPLRLSLTLMLTSRMLVSNQPVVILVSQPLTDKAN